MSAIAELLFDEALPECRSGPGFFDSQCSARLSVHEFAVRLVYSVGGLLEDILDECSR